MVKGKLLLLFLVGCLFTGRSFGQQNFVKTKGTQFTIDGKPYYYIGANYWYGGLLQAVKGEQGRKRLKQELDFLKAKGVTNLRIMAGSEGLGQINGVKRVSPSLQPQEGVFKPELLKSLDYLLNEMHHRNMRAVLFLSNNWEWSGGFLQYLNWNGKLDETTLRKKLSWEEQRDLTSQFYNCEGCKKDYERQVKMILSHVNTYNQLKYTNDPTIMSWELANEPRPMRADAVGAYEQWILATATLIRSIDKNHLITIGTEGVQGTEDRASLYQDIHSSKTIDYLTIHIWPKNWGWFRDSSIVDSLPQVIQKSLAYIKQHAAMAVSLQKPLVIEEFGLPRDRQSFDPASATTSRDRYYEAIFSAFKQSAENSGAIGGCNFWAFGGMIHPVPGQVFWKEGDSFIGDPPQEEQGLNAVFSTDQSTWKTIEKYIPQ